MKVLCIGGCHVGNYGLKPHEGFVQQWTAALSQTLNEPVETTCFALIPLRKLPLLLEQHQPAFEEADLIVLQMGNYELSYRGRFRTLFSRSCVSGMDAKVVGRSTNDPLNPTLPNQLSDVPIYDYPRSCFDATKNSLKWLTLSVFELFGGELSLLKQFTHSLPHLTKSMAAYAEKTILLTPFPSLNAIDNYLRRASLPLFYRIAQRGGFALIDTCRAVPSRRAFFLPDTYHLNAAGHRRIAQLLSRHVQLTTVTDEVICPY